jgi:hypothetical protein
LFEKPKQIEQAPQPLSPDEQDIYKRLHERVTKADAQKNLKNPAADDSFVGNYQNSMRVIQSL